MSAASLMTLEHLQQQVESGSFSIAAACSRVDNIVQNLIKDDMTRPLLAALPRLLTLILGDEQTMGWTERASDEGSLAALGNLLKPTGTLFAALLAYSGGDAPMPFELPVSQLPMPLQKQITRSALGSLPVPLDVCIANVAKEGKPLYVLRLDASEYFIFKLLNILPSSLHKHHGLSTRSRSSSFGGALRLSRSLSFESLVLRMGGERAFRFNQEHAALLYHRLIEAYLDFFMPLADGVRSGRAADGMEGTAFSIKTLRSATGVWMGWRLACFFFTMVTELWLHRQEYQAEAGSNVASSPPFLPPSADHFEALRQVTQHLVRAILSPLPPTLPSQLHRFYEQLVDSSFVPFRIHLYRFLRLSLAKCPADNTIVVVGSLWIEFVAPWRYIDRGAGRGSGDDSATPSAATDVWAGYVLNNYFYYHVLLNSLLDYAEVMTESFGEALGTRQQRTLPMETAQNILLPLLLILGRALGAVGPFATLLREVEERELRATPSIMDRHSSSTVSPHKRPAATTVGVKEQLSALESESFTITLLFDPKSRQRILHLLYWLERIYCAIPGAPTAGQAAAKLGHEGPLNYDRGSAGRGGGQPSYEIHSVIMQCEEELCATFHITEAEYARFAVRFASSRPSADSKSSTGADADLTLDASDALAPAPRRRPKTIPTMDPDERLMQKMKSNPSGTATEENRLVRSYESALLVEMMAHLGDFCNLQYAALMQREQATSLPAFIRNLRFNFRFFAAYPNLLFLLLLYLGLSTILSLTRTILGPAV